MQGINIEPAHQLGCARLEGTQGHDSIRRVGLVTEAEYILLSISRSERKNSEQAAANTGGCRYTRYTTDVLATCSTVVRLEATASLLLGERLR